MPKKKLFSQAPLTREDIMEAFAVKDAFGGIHSLRNPKAAVKLFTEEQTLWDEALPSSLPIREEICRRPAEVTESLAAFFQFGGDGQSEEDPSFYGSDDDGLEPALASCRQDVADSALGWIAFHSPGGQALLRLCLGEHNAAAEAFCAEIDGYVSRLINEPDGIAESRSQLGAELARAELARSLTRVDGEKSLSQLRRDAESVVGDLKRVRKSAVDQADALIEQMDSRISSEAAKLEGLVVDHRKASQAALKAAAQELSDYRSDYAEKIDSKIEEIETAVLEKTVLQQPTEFWQKRGRRLRNQGLLWASALSVTLAGSAVGLLYYVSALVQSPQANPSGAHLFQSITGFIVAAGVIGYALRVLGKLTLSAFHLQRDAEERAELTQFYLGLGIENEMSEESRNLALRALFARSESGLFSSESGSDLGSLMAAARNHKA